ncbi:MAG TPA: carbonic anhydrase [Microbacteriaceae bacterium]|nr:carbonic anhydrase [Microbacteriaceae bacterium]
MTDLPTPAQAWQLLRDGNARYAADERTHPRQDAARRAELAFEQHPFATLVGCGDSRVALEHIFDLGLGDAFVVRNAGHVLTESAIGSIEYGLGPLTTPILVIAAHERCGAVRAAIDAQGAGAAALPPHIAATIAPIASAVHSVAGTAEGETLDPASVDAAEVGKAHVRASIELLLTESDIARKALEAGTLAIVGAYYRLSGPVETVCTRGLD